MVICDLQAILLFRHVFHKTCVDPWLSEHCTCPMCKLNILKALGIVVSQDFLKCKGLLFKPNSLELENYHDVLDTLPWSYYLLLT